MLKRTITAVLLTIFALVLIFMLPAFWFLCITAAVILLAAWEWSRLAGLSNKLSQAVFVVVMAACLWFVRFVPVLPVLIVACVWWLIAFYFVVIYPRYVSCWSSILVRCVMGILVLVPSWLSVVVLRSSYHGSQTLLFMLLIIWAADVGAYFAGRFWGKHKLMPQVSPGKTWQGLWGGLLLSMIVAMVGSSVLQVDFMSWFVLMLLVVLLNVYSVGGDLFESMLKRFSNVKDSSHILPGHGGLLDRLDSLTAVAPLFLLTWLLYLKY